MLRGIRRITNDFLQGRKFLFIDAFNLLRRRHRHGVILAFKLVSLTPEMITASEQDYQLFL